MLEGSKQDQKLPPLQRRTGQEIHPNPPVKECVDHRQRLFYMVSGSLKVRDNQLLPSSILLSQDLRIAPIWHQ